MLDRFKVSLGLTVLVALIISAPAKAADHWQLNMPKGVTPLSQDMYNLHMIAMFICTIIGIIVFGVMIYALIYHRKSRGFKAASFHSNTKLELIWSIIPFFILVGLAIPATKVLMRMEDPSKSEVTIKIVGSQWKWRYQYLDQGISYYSNLATPYDQIQNNEAKSEWYLLEVDKPLVLPVNRKIRFLVTSTDVIHSWWVPELGVKRDAIPGFMHEAWATIEKPGTYRGQCTELCGINHAYMPIVVEAVPEEQFNEWVAKQPKVATPTSSSSITPVDNQFTLQQLMLAGRNKYEQLCLACHKSDGTGLPPLYPKLKGSSIAVGHPISRHIDIILKGVPGTAMQAYGELLTDDEVAAIVTYERNAWGNNTGDVVQPAEVRAERQESIQAPKMVQKAQVGGLQ